jgi:hypothetical protein
MKRLLALGCLSLLLGAACFLTLRPASPAPLATVSVMPLPYSIPSGKISLFDRWVPRQPSWGWLWRLKETIQGRPKVCDLAATVIDFAASGDSLLTNLSLPKADYADTNGQRIWLLSETRLNALRRDLSQMPGAELVCSPRITTADGRQACVMSGSTIPIQGVLRSVGLSMEFLPHLRPDATDLTTIITLTEAITNQVGMSAGPPSTGATGVQTNLAVAARIQVPKWRGVFLLGTPSAAGNHKRIGVLLSVTTPTPKK